MESQHRTALRFARGERATAATTTAKLRAKVEGAGAIRHRRLLAHALTDIERVEIDGALHLVVRTYWDDMFRGNELTIGREAAIRFPSYVIHANDPVAVAGP
jgi:hypothetical protein